MKNIWIVITFLLVTTALTGQELVEYSFRVEGTCGMCQERIEKIALKKGKAKTAEWNVDTKILKVEIDEAKTQVSHIRHFLAQAGHDNGDFIAPQEIYDDLHGCCKYRPDDLKENHDTPPEHFDTRETSAVSSLGYIPQAEGHIYALENGEKIPLIGANITFEGAHQGTTTDSEGYFQVQNKGQHQAIRISYIGYEDQVIALEDDYIDVTLADGHQLETVEIVYKKKTTEISFVNTINVETISREELCKAACCNLSESFETNPSVDVSFNDAITGTKQIQMLGLAGPYVQINRELLPDVRGLNNLFGLNTTPGPWIQSIQLIKGTGSVVNGYESITGQINVELKKPERGEVLHLNGFLNNGGRLELNGNTRLDVTENISTGLLFHGKSMQNPHDRNGDGFTDMPFEKDFVVANRWKFKRKKNFEGQFGVKVSNLNHEGGFHDHFAGLSEAHEFHWRMKTEIRRNEVWGKIGYVNAENPDFSVGLQLSASDHSQDSNFGLERYDAQQQSYYGNLILQNIFKKGHILRAGLTYTQDDLIEEVTKADRYVRNEKVPGAYAEFTYKKDDKLSIIPGLRVDHHNTYGTIVIPRLHAKYNLSDRSVIRFTGGKGFRTASIFSENAGLFATNRTVRVRSTNDETPYGLEAEVAWNYGLSYNKGFDIGGKEFILSLDAFRTQFENQIVVDWENAREVSFYNLQGESYANSYQAKIDYEVIENLDVRVAYRLFDVQTQYTEAQLERPLVSKHRAFINAAYKTKSDWHFDLTWNWRGSMRLPDTSINPVEFQRPDRTPAYSLLSGQISKRWGSKWDIYLGAENILNYKQEDAIIASEDAFGEFFDGSLTYAPLFGTNVYIGFRFNLIKDEK